MTLLQGIPAVLLALPALSLAAGLDLYLTLLLLGISPHTGLWETPLPGALGDLDSAGVHLVAGGFFLLEFTAERWPVSTLVWNGFHAVIRPLAGVLLSLLLLDGQPTVVVVMGAALAALLASLAHGVRTGTRLVLWFRSAPSPNRVLLSVAEDVVVVGLVVMVLDLPLVAAWLGLAVAAVALLRAPSDFRAFRFAIELGGSRVFRSLSRARWRTPEEFPAWVNTELHADMANHPGVGTKGTPVGAMGLLGAPRFARGWLVSLGGSPSFIYRSRRGPKRVLLDHADHAEVLDQGLFRRVQLTSEDQSLGSVLVPRSGPGVDALAVDLRG